MDKRAEALEILSEKLGVPIVDLATLLRENDLVLDFKKILAKGYKGREDWIYPEEAVQCSCCGRAVVKHSGEYSNYPPCGRCGATEGLCYDCPGCDDT